MVNWCVFAIKTTGVIFIQLTWLRIVLAYFYKPGVFSKSAAMLVVIAWFVGPLFSRR